MVTLSVNTQAWRCCSALNTTRARRAVECGLSGGAGASGLIARSPPCLFDDTPGRARQAVGLVSARNVGENTARVTHTPARTSSAEECLANDRLWRFRSTCPPSWSGCRCVRGERLEDTCAEQQVLRFPASDLGRALEDPWLLKGLAGRELITSEVDVDASG